MTNYEKKIHISVNIQNNPYSDNFFTQISQKKIDKQKKKKALKKVVKKALKLSKKEKKLKTSQKGERRPQRLNSICTKKIRRGGMS